MINFQLSSNKDDLMIWLWNGLIVTQGVAQFKNNTDESYHKPIQFDLAQPSLTGLEKVTI